MAERTPIITRIGQCETVWDDKWTYVLVYTVETETGETMLLPVTVKAAEELRKLPEQLPTAPQSVSPLQRL
jgi:hypothetical protein